MDIVFHEDRDAVQRSTLGIGIEGAGLLHRIRRDHEDRIATFFRLKSLQDHLGTINDGVLLTRGKHQRREDRQQSTGVIRDHA